MSKERLDEVDVRVIRHGQAEHNVGSRYYLKDPKLTELGKKQAKGIKLDFVPDVVFFSPLTRTVETTLIMLSNFEEKNEIKAIPIADIQEMNAGKLNCDTGIDPLSLTKKFPGIDFSSLKKDWFIPSYSMNKRLKNFYHFLSEYLEKNEKVEKIAIVCHYGVIFGMFGTRVGNCGVVRGTFKIKEKVLDFVDY